MKTYKSKEEQLEQGINCPDLLESMSDGVAIYEAIDDGQDFVFCEHNPAGERITGIPRDQVMGRRVTEIFPGIEAFGLLEILSQVFKTGKRKKHTSSLYRDDRITLWVENSVFKLPSGEIVAVYRDITDRKQAETALSQANLIINRSPVVAFLWKNQEGWPVQFVSENVENLLGYSAREFMDVAISYDTIIHSDDLGRVTAEVAANSTKKEISSFVHEPYRILTKNGEIKWIHDTTYIRKNSQGEITHYEGTLYDISMQQSQQERIEHLSLLRKTGLTIHRHLATFQDSQQLLQAICDVFVNEKGYRSAWVVLLDEKQHCKLTANAGLLKDFNLLEQAIGKGNLPPCITKTIQESQLLWQDSQSSLCGGCPLANGYPDTGIMAAPLLHGGKFYGVLTVSLAAEMVTNSEERELFEEMARDIAFALFNRAQDKKRQEHEQEIAIRDQISRTFIIHHDNNLYGGVLDIVLAAMDSKLGVFGYLEGPDMLICPSMTLSAWKQCEIPDKTIVFPRQQWAGIWKDALTTGTTRFSNSSFTVPEGHLAIDNSMATGIVYGGQVIGLLQVANKAGGYDEQDKHLFESMAVTIAPILQARLEQQQTETELQSALDEYADLYNNAPDMFISVEADTANILQCNQTLLTTLGYERDEVIGHPVFMLYHPDCRDECKTDVFPTFCRTGKVINKELQLQRKDGSSLPVTLDVSAIRDQNSTIIQSRSIFHDISDRKKLEEQVIISEKMTTIAGLAAGVAHEINTPLSGILQSIQLIEMGLDPTREQNRTLAADCGIDLTKVQDYLLKKDLDFFLTGIRDSATTAAHIIADLLQFSRPQESTPLLTRLTELIDRSIELAKADYSLKKEYNILDVEFIRQYSPEQPEVYCIAIEIEQVLINLIKNSCQAMAGDSSSTAPHIILRTKQRDKMAVIEVEDNGPGIEEEICRHIFDPFFTTKEVGKGTGLGLSVAYSIIKEKHGGTIRVESTPEDKTLFIIELPMERTGDTTNE
jgi:PAS domain S-box-containing protein